MPRPIESLLSLPRVRLIDRVPILETEEYVKRLMKRTEYHAKLVQRAFQVSERSAQQFASDDHGLCTLLAELDSADYVVTKRSKSILEAMLSGICADGSIFKEFEQDFNPLFEMSRSLREVSKLAGSLADRTKEESLDVARALLIDLPTQARDLRLRDKYA